VTCGRSADVYGVRDRKQAVSGFSSLGDPAGALRVAIEPPATLRVIVRDLNELLSEWRETDEQVVK
jgi:hypothetical protein